MTDHGEARIPKGALNPGVGLREEGAGPLRPGDRVELVGKVALYHGVAHGTVHAIHAGMEDTVEVLLDNGVFTCTDPPKVRRV